MWEQNRTEQNKHVQEHNVYILGLHDTQTTTPMRAPRACENFLSTTYDNEQTQPEPNRTDGTH